MKKLCLLLLLLTGCKNDRKVNTSFYYWKTVYQNSTIQANYLQHCHVSRLYVRIMDVDFAQRDTPAPVSPIVFKDHLPDTIKIVPVVFIVNDMLKQMDTAQLKVLAGNIVPYIDMEIRQSGKKSYDELQIDCDWTATTRDNYFYLL